MKQKKNKKQGHEELTENENREVTRMWSSLIKEKVDRLTAPQHWYKSIEMNSLVI